MSHKTRSSIVLVAFAACVGIALSACQEVSAPHLIAGARAVHDSADTTSCPYGWTVMNGVVTCNSGQ